MNTDFSPHIAHSIVDTYYSEGKFLAESGLGRDAEYKIRQLTKLLLRQDNNLVETFSSVVDIGCGPGETTRMLHDFFSCRRGKTTSVTGFDVHPGMHSMNGNGNGLKYRQGDFCETEIKCDLAVLLDVIEHVPATVSFLGQIAMRARWVALHIPLDDNLLVWLRNHVRPNLSNPGHLLIMNPASALNLLALAGLRVVDFEYSPSFKAPSGRETLLQRILFPFRQVMFSISPYLLQKTLGGVSLTVLARSPIYDLL